MSMMLDVLLFLAMRGEGLKTKVSETIFKNSQLAAWVDIDSALSDRCQRWLPSLRRIMVKETEVTWVLSWDKT